MMATMRPTIARTLAAFALAACLAPPAAHAQRVVTYDTLAMGSPVAVSCGFCAGERFGVIFRELPPPARGLEAADFPLELREVHVAMASARLTGAAGSYACGGSTMGATIMAELEVWSGTTPPAGSIAAKPAMGAWDPAEQLLWVGPAAIQLSVSDMDGSSRYTTQFNRLIVQDAMGAPIPVDGAQRYIRVVLTLPDGMGTSSSCTDAMLTPPAGFPMRDGDGTIATERSFIYASGAGWFWNEGVPGGGIGGDWGIRIEVSPMGVPVDGGVDGGPDGGSDGGTDSGTDTGPNDGGAGADAGMADPGGGGCSCRVQPSDPPKSAWALGLMLVSLALRRRRRG